MQQTSICGLGQVALGPLRSILERFPEARGEQQPIESEAVE
jgi:NADH:ubiquinone oxidoreductase subunit F (NADH-binding)